MREFSGMELCEEHRCEFRCSVLGSRDCCALSIRMKTGRMSGKKERNEAESGLPDAYHCVFFHSERAVRERALPERNDSRTELHTRATHKSWTPDAQVARTEDTGTAISFRCVQHDAHLPRGTHLSAWAPCLEGTVTSLRASRDPRSIHAQIVTLHWRTRFSVFSNGRGCLPNSFAGEPGSPAVFERGSGRPDVCLHARLSLGHLNLPSYLAPEGRLAK